MAFNFDKKIREFKSLKKDLPVKIGNIAKNHYVKSFRDQGFTDEKLNPWASRKRPSRSDKRNRGNRAILIKSGQLRRSIRVGRATFNRIEVGSYGIKYARFHNRGEGNLPVRKFVGSSQVMNQKIIMKIRKEVKDIFK